MLRSARGARRSGASQAREDTAAQNWGFIRLRSRAVAIPRASVFEREGDALVAALKRRPAVFNQGP